MSDELINHRPNYEDENPEFVKKENETRLEIEQLTGWRFVKIPKKYGADYLVYNENNVLFALSEIKNRNEPSDKYPNYMISLHKVVMSLIFANFLRMPLQLWIKWDNQKIGYTIITRDIERKIMMLTKPWRKDIQDLEPCILIPMTKFKIYDRSTTVNG